VSPFVDDLEESCLGFARVRGKRVHWQ
jgi:hypothetical protein